MLHTSFAHSNDMLRTAHKHVNRELREMTFTGITVEALPHCKGQTTLAVSPWMDLETECRGKEANHRREHVSPMI